MMNDDEKRQFIEKKLSEPNEYRYRYVAFLDMLGFKDMCDNKNISCYEIKAIFNEIELLKLKYDTFSKIVISDEIVDDTEFTFMSDSIIISAPHSDLGLLFILYLSNFIQNMLLQEDVPLRGGIAEGNFFKLDNVMFGPALVSAYLIESQKAVYPRIVLCEEIIARLREKGVFKKKSVADYMAKYKTQNSEEYKNMAVYTEIETFIKQSTEDDCFFVHYLNPVEMLLLSHDQKKREKIESVIQNGLSHHDERIKEKYQWLEKYYNSSIESLKRVFHFNLEDLNNA